MQAISPAYILVRLNPFQHAFLVSTSRFQAPFVRRSDDSFLGALRLHIYGGPPPLAPPPRGVSHALRSYAYGGLGVNLAYSLLQNALNFLFGKIAPKGAAFRAGLVATVAFFSHPLSRARTRWLVDGFLPYDGIVAHYLAAFRTVLIPKLDAKESISVPLFWTSVGSHMAHAVALYFATMAFSVMRVEAQLRVDQRKRILDAKFRFKSHNAHTLSLLKKEKEHLQFQELFARETCDVLASAFAAIAVLPLAVVRTRLEYQGEGAMFARGMLDAVVRIYSEEGFAGFLRGGGDMIVGLGPLAAWIAVVYMLGRGMVELSESVEDEEDR